MHHPILFLSLKAGTMSDTKLYPVLSNVRHNGILYKPEDPDHSKIALTEKQAASLLKLGVIMEPSEAAIEEFSQTVADTAVKLADTLNQLAASTSVDTQNAPEAQKSEGGETADTGLSVDGTGTDPLVLDVAGDPALRLAAIRNVLPSLKADEDMTKAGHPKVEAIEKLVGFDVTADEVKSVWAEVEARKSAIPADETDGGE